MAHRRRAGVDASQGQSGGDRQGAQRRDRGTAKGHGVPRRQHARFRFARSLKADFLLENLALAYKARNEFPWAKQIPEPIFFNYVLPYANVDESRHPWRKEFYDLCKPFVKDCKTPAEVAQKLNEKVFPTLNVKYSTKRKKANQSPKESIEQGLASCTGLSIVSIDACRSVGVPVRLVGTAMWVDKSGNHNWVEIWDRDWHFTGASRHPTGQLDRDMVHGKGFQGDQGFAQAWHLCREL